MPDTRNRRDDKFAKYDAMSTEELQQLLREDASKPVGEESDTDVLFYVMEVLAKRRKERNEGKSPEEALESFKKHYDTENEISSDSESVPAGPKRVSIGRWMKGLAAAAAILVFIIGGSITAHAMGFDLWEIIAKWTQETFHFSYAGDENTDAPDKDDATPFAGLQTLLDLHGVEAALVPTWIPDGYIEVDVSVEETPKQRRFAAKYQSGDDKIRIRIANYLDTAPSQIEQSDSLIEVYQSNGVDYYIFNNYDLIKAVWITDSYECYIMGPLELSEIKEIIDSIGKG